MLRNFYFSIFLCYFGIHRIFAEIPSYNCTEFKPIPVYCDFYNINLTSTTKNFKVIPHRDASEITGVWFKNNSKVEVLTSDICNHLPSIESFVAEELGLMSVEENAFQNCLRMKNMSLEHNLLDSVPIRIFEYNRELEWVFLGNNKFTQLDMALFKNNPYIFFLRLSDNQMKDLFIPSEIPVMNSLKNVRLHNNVLSDINIEILFKKSPELVGITLEGNNFTCERQQVIAETLFTKDILFNDLGECHNNDIQDENIFTYRCITVRHDPRSCQLENVTLRSVNKPLEVIPNRFRLNIYIVRFRNSNMEVLTRNICDQLPKIRQFYPVDLGLISVEENAFDNCLNMIAIYLSNNSLETLPVDVFKYNSELHYIFLDGNKFTKIDMFLFNNNHKLSYLQLNNNQIKEVFSIVDMTEKIKLSIIQLQDNQLTDLNINTVLLKCPNLKVFLLHNNSFQCSEEREIAKILIEKQIQSINFGNCIENVGDNLVLNINTYSTDNCGDIKNTAGYIYGGEAASKEMYSWVAAMWVRGDYACTVNYISNTRAVTAAHCFKNVRSRKHILIEIFNNANVSVKDYKLHPNFKRVPKFDIAILVTDQISDKDFVPVCLPSEIVQIPGFQGKVVSYAPSPGNNDQTLLTAHLSVVRNKYCNEITPNLPESTLCVINGHRGKWICKGDSGAGFMMISQAKAMKDNRYFLHGIVSSGKERVNCSASDYVILTDVTKFLSFVTNITKSEEKSSSLITNVIGNA